MFDNVVITKDMVLLLGIIIGICVGVIAATVFAEWGYDDEER